MAHSSSLVRVLTCAALTLYCVIGSVSSQDTCQALGNTGLAVPDGTGIELDFDDCCEVCRVTADCTAALYESALGLCYAVAAGAQLDEDLLIPDTINSFVLFPDEVNVAASEDDGVADDAIIFGLRLPAIVGIVAGVIGLLCIVISSIAFCNARRKQRNHQAILSAEV